MKKIVLGILIGFCLAFTTSAFADNIKEYILTKISYPIIVNGTEYVDPELPALNYKGATYLPLKGIGDVLGSPVKWNPDLKRVEVGALPTPTPTPTSTPVAIATPSPTPAPPKQMVDYTSVIKINGDLYGVDWPIGLSVDDKQNYFVSNIDGVATINPLIDYASHESKIKVSYNPFLKGILQWDTSKVYGKPEDKYLGINQRYQEAIYHNKDNSKSYFVSNKPGDTKGIYFGDLQLIPIKDLLTTLGISYKIEIDVTNKLIIWSFD